MLMKRMTKRLMLALTTALLLTLLTVTAYAGTIPGTAKLTITPTETKVSGDTATVTYSVTVTPPEGKALGVFSVQLQPSVGMTLAQDASGITMGDGSLSYSPATEKGIFDLYGYTAKTGYFAAVGTTPDRRMTEEATVLTIQATMPANKDGTYTLGAEFIAALDGSGDVYTAQVMTTPVAITGGQEPVAEDTPVITETNGDDLKTDANTAPDGTSGNGNGAAGGDTAGAGDTANGSGTANDGAAASDGVTGSDAASPADGSTPGGQEKQSGSAALWIVLAVVIVAAATAVLVLKKKKK